MRTEDLAQIATTTIVCRNKRLKVCLDIPLVDKTDYTLYQLHSVSLKQSILRNGSGKAYVRSAFSPDAMEESRQTYILMNQEEMDQCKDLEHFYLCLRSSPIYETSTRETCESSLLNNPTAEASRLCKVQVSYKKDPYFAQSSREFKLPTGSSFRRGNEPDSPRSSQGILLPGKTRRIFRRRSKTEDTPIVEMSDP